MVYFNSDYINFHIFFDDAEWIKESRHIVSVDVQSTERHGVVVLLDGWGLPASELTEVAETRAVVVVGVPERHLKGSLRASCVAFVDSSPHVLRSVNSDRLTSSSNSLHELQSELAVAFSIVIVPRAARARVCLYIDPYSVI